MYKKVIALVLSVAALFTFASCSMLDTLLNKDEQSSDGRQTFQLNETASTMFFDFSIVSAEIVDEYAGILPTEGKQLIAVVATVTNTFGSELEMYADDFFLQWGKNGEIESGVFPIEAIDDTMAPETYFLADGETMEFHYIFEVPSTAQELHFVYSEVYVEEDNEEKYGDYYSFSLPL